MPKIVKRTGANGFPGWEGMQRDGDPSSIAENKFWLLENVRRSAGNLTERGGQTRLNSSTLAGGELINGIYDSAYGGAGVGGWGGGGGGGVTTGAGSIPAPSGSCPVPQPTTGDGVKFYSLRGTTASASTFHMMFYDNEKYPSDAGGGIAESVFPIPYHGTTDPMYGLATFGLENIAYGGKIYHFVQALTAGTVRVGVMAPAFGDVRPPAVWIFDQALSGVGGVVVGGFVINNGTLYYTLFGIGSTSGVSPRLYSFDGIQSVEAFNPALSAIPAEAIIASTVTTFGGKIWMGFSNSHLTSNTYYPQKIVNTLGTSVTIGAVNFGLGKGYVVDSGSYTARQTMVEFKGKLYLGGQRETPEGPAIYSYDATGTVAVARDLSAVGPTPAGQWSLSGVYTMFVWKGYLWFYYNTRALSEDAFKLGKFDGTTWTNDVSATGLGLEYSRMAEYKGAAVLFGHGAGMVRSTDGVTWAAFGAAPAGGNPNGCNVAVMTLLGAVL